MINYFNKLLSSQDQKQLLKRAFIFSAIMHILAVIFSEGFHRPDEHLGIFRLMSFKLGNFPESELSWEYGTKIRPWLHPYAFYLIAKITNFIGIVNPFHLSFILRLLCSALGFYTLIEFTKYSFSFFKENKTKNLVIILLATMWYLPFFHARTTAENLSLSFFILGIINTGRDDQKTLSFVKAGIFFGISYILRFQMGVMVLFAMLWPLFNKKLNLNGFLKISLFLFLTILFSTYIDYLGYGEWTFTSWNYVYQNIFKGAASGFGVSPWYYYFTKSLIKGIPPYSLILVLPLIWIWTKRPLHYLTWITLPFITIHSLIGHKELRFIFGIGIFAPIALGILLENTNITKMRGKLINAMISIAIFVNVSALLISSFKPAYTPINFYRHLYNKEKPIKDLYTLSLIRDELKFYQKAPFKQIYIEKDVEGFLSNVEKNSRPTWIFTSNFDYILRIEKLGNCKRDYSSYPAIFLDKKYRKIFRKSKIWSLYLCGKNISL